MRILTADDDPATRLILRKMLEKLGHDVIECEEGETALSILRSPDGPHLAFLDWMMPGLTGVEICRLLRQDGLLVQPYLVLLTGRSNAEDILEGLRCGANDYVTKPFNLGEFTARVQVAVSLLELQETVHQQQVQIHTASRYAALGEMASGIAHEINNPLAIICGRVEQLEKILDASPVDGEKARKICEGIKSTSFRISKVISGLRSFAGDAEIEEVSLTPVHQIIDDALSLCRTRFKDQGVSLRVEPIHPELALECQGVQISRVMLNLLNNAFYAVENISERWVKVEVRDAEAWIEISVTDSGEGIPAENRPRLMQPFFTTRRIGKGSGLGLCSARGIVESHDGELFLDERSPHTRFVIRLPK